MNKFGENMHKNLTFFSSKNMSLHRPIDNNYEMINKYLTKEWMKIDRKGSNCA